MTKAEDGSAVIVELLTVICAGAWVVGAACVTGVRMIGSGEVVGPSALLVTAALFTTGDTGALLAATGVLVLDVVGELSVAGGLALSGRVAASFAAEIPFVPGDSAIILDSSVGAGSTTVKAAVVGTGEDPGCRVGVAKAILPFISAAADVVVASVENPVPRDKA
jgi:hypothetical protein